MRVFEAAESGGAGGGGAGPENGGGGPAPAVIASAKKLGWAPKEQWRGNPDHWVDADEFVRRGEQFIPFLQADRRKLKNDLDARDARITQLQSELSEVKEGVTALTQFSRDMARDRLTRRKGEIGAQLKAARESGDTVREAELQEELGETVVNERKLKETAPPATRTPAQEQQPPQNQIQPWVQQFISGSQDFFNDPERRNLFNAVAATMRQSGDTRVGETAGVEFMSEAKERVEQLLGGGQSLRQRPPRSEEDGSPPRSGGTNVRSSNGKSFSDLPENARNQCNTDESKFVGKDKVFKTQAEWRKYYLSEYFGPSTTGMGE